MSPKWELSSSTGCSYFVLVTVKRLDWLIIPIDITSQTAAWRFWRNELLEEDSL
jgi:hypothetical protein